MAGERSPCRNLLQKFLELPFPEFRHGGSAVSTCLLARRDQVHAAISYALELTLHDCELRRIALVVGGVDGEESGLDTLEAGRGIVVA